MATKYYGDGVEISRSKALELLTNHALHQGVCEQEFMSLWKSHEESEESRDVLFDLSSCTIEIVAE